AKGMLEHLLDVTLGGHASEASLQEKQERVRRAMIYLAEENNPELRLMAKTYADRLSSKLIVQNQAPADIHTLERLLGRALTGSGPAPTAAPQMGGGPQARSRP